MPLLLDNMRAEFARFLADDPTARWRMDAALAHVLTLAYERGLDDGRLNTQTVPASNHTAAECRVAFEWLRTEATKEGALEAKQTKNEGRQWPDWRTAQPGKAIEHVRDEVTS